MASVLPDHPPLLWDITHSFPVGVLLTDRHGDVLDTNIAWSELTGLTPDESLGRGWLASVAQRDRPALEKLACDAAQSMRRGVGEWAIVTDVGDRMAKWRAAPHDHVIDDCRAVVMVDDVDDERRREAELRFAATHDALTRVANRASFVSAVEHALVRLDRHPGAVGVLFVDFDGFKRVNDKGGHGLGDRVLAAEADNLRAALRPSDIIGRLGGDEFGVLCEDLTSGDDMAEIADRLSTRLAHHTTVDGHELEISASVGVAVTANSDTGAEGLIAAADRAMYQVKRAAHRGGRLVRTLES